AGSARRVRSGADSSGRTAERDPAALERISDATHRGIKSRVAGAVFLADGGRAREILSRASAAVRADGPDAGQPAGTLGGENNETWFQRVGNGGDAGGRAD